QTSTYIQPQQGWYASTNQQQFNPPPNYSTATRPRFPSVMPQQSQNQSSPQTLLAPLRSSTPYITRAPLVRPQYSSQQQQQQPPPSQDPSIR
ncbi:unnamed protein product, partial [Adineta ricciae]